MAVLAGMAPTLLLLFAALLPAVSALIGHRVTWEKCKQSDYEIIVDSNPRPDTTNVDDFQLDHCDLNGIPPGAFEGFPNLNTLWLNQTDFEDIDLAVFRPVTHITYLNLRGNKLKNVPVFGNYSLFPNMTWIVLAENLFTSLDDPKTFSSMLKLEEIELSRNQIKHINDNIFKPLTYLKRLSLDNNKITELTPSMFQLKSLEELDLSDNLIEYVPPGSFLGTKLQLLLLARNKFSYLPENFVTSLMSSGANLQTLSIYHMNPWHCGCLLEVWAEMDKFGIVRDHIPLDCQLKCNRPSLPAGVLPSTPSASSKAAKTGN